MQTSELMFTAVTVLLLSLRKVVAFSLRHPLLKVEWTDWVGCISHFEAKRLQSFKEMLGNRNFVDISTSIDLSKSSSPVQIDHDGIYHVNVSEASPKRSLMITWEEVRLIASDSSHCYALFNDGSKPWKISTISTLTNYPASLFPSPKFLGPPTLLLGGFTMHRIAGENMNPKIDTESKVKGLRLTRGCHVLDTCMGLGYSAILAAQSGSVLTFEKDPASLEMAAFNPWSRPLFDRSLPIQLRHEDVCQGVSSLPGEIFDAIVHDPPAKALCDGDLYAESFYRDLYRVLKPKGKGVMFHYIGNPNSKESGRLYRGVMDRLQRVGFQSIRILKEAFGLLAYS